MQSPRRGAGPGLPERSRRVRPIALGDCIETEESETKPTTGSVGIGSDLINTTISKQDQSGGEPWGPIDAVDWFELACARMCQGQGVDEQSRRFDQVSTYE